MSLISCFSIITQNSKGTVYKKDSKLDWHNYRPISLVSNIEKVLEIIMYKRFYHSLTENDIVFDLQFGFRQKRSIAHVLINFTGNIRQVLNEGYIGRGIIADLQKAFRSYLCNQKQYLFINGYDTDLTKINCDVPQGSVLDPIPFSQYINDLNQAIKFCKVHHFADDTNLLYLHKSIKKLNLTKLATN